MKSHIQFALHSTRKNRFHLVPTEQDADDRPDSRPSLASATPSPGVCARREKHTMTRWHGAGGRSLGSEVGLPSARDGLQTGSVLFLSQSAAPRAALLSRAPRSAQTPGPGGRLCPRRWVTRGGSAAREVPQLGWARPRPFGALSPVPGPPEPSSLPRPGLCPSPGDHGMRLPSGCECPPLRSFSDITFYQTTASSSRRQTPGSRR